MHRARPGDRRRDRAALTEDPKQIVAGGYDAIAERYADWARSFWTPTRNWLELLLARLDEGSDVLDLGCGSGTPFTKQLALRHRVTGVDISPRQIELAREGVPEATFLCADAAEVELLPESFDAVVSLFMFGHVPRAEQGSLLERIAAWLRPGGLVVASFPVGGSEDTVEADWLGAPMFFASFDREQTLGLVEAADFVVEREQVVAQDEPGHGAVSFMWVLARKPG